MYLGTTKPIKTQNTHERANILPPLSWSKLPTGTQFLVFMTDYHVTAIPIKQNGNYLNHRVLHYILLIFFGFHDNLSHSKKMSLYNEEARKHFIFYQGIN